MKRSFNILAFAVAMAVPVVGFAQQEASDEEKRRTAEVPAQAVEEKEPSGPNTGKLSFTGGVDFTTAYFFRGYLQEDQDLIVQPFANMYYKFIDEDDVTLTGYLGAWSSFHGEKTGADDGTFGAWYEADLYAGVDVGFGDGFTLGAIYTLYTYPNGAFDTIEELGFKLSYDDTDKTGLPFALKPYAAVYFETNDQNGSEDTYFEFGIAPTVYTFNETGKSPVALSVPVTVGTSLDDYFLDDDGGNEFLGYASVGLAASVPLPIDSGFGAWSLNASVTYLHLFADGLETTNNGDDNEVIGKIGVSFAY